MRSANGSKSLDLIDEKYMNGLQYEIIGLTFAGPVSSPILEVFEGRKQAFLHPAARMGRIVGTDRSQV